MSSQVTPTITVQDPQNNPLRLGETRLARNLKDDQEKQDRDSRLGKNLIITKSVASGFRDSIQAGAGGTSPNLWGATPANFKGMCGTPSLQILKLNNLVDFSLNLSVVPFQQEFVNTSVLPTSDFTCPVNFCLAQVNTVFNPISSFGFQPIFSKSLPAFEYSLTNSFTLRGISENFDLLNYAPITSRSGSGIDQIFISNPSQITEAQAQDIFANGATFIYGVFIDVTSLTGDNLTFMTNNVGLGVVWVYTTNLTLSYTGLQTVI